MDWTVHFTPLIPLPILWAATAVAILLIALLIYRRARGAWLRALALIALLCALANPTLRQEERESLDNIAIVIVDESASQTLEKRTDASKLMREGLEERLNKIPSLKVKWVSGARPKGGTRRGSVLFEDLNTALKDTPPDRLAGVIFVTDGQIHDVPKSKADLGFDAPIHTLLTGRNNEFDRRIEIVKAPRYGIVGQTRTLTLKIRQDPKAALESPPADAAQKPLTLRIRRQDQPDELQQVQVDETVNIQMAFPHAGTNIVELELETANGELTTANNRAVIAAEGVRENLRVLLVSGKPHAGERTWRNLLKSDAAVDLVHFTILRPPQKQDGTPINELSLIAFPTRELFSQKIEDFDLIIFDHYEYRGILRRLYFENIARYVSEHGGALLVAAGDDYAGRASLFRTPLAPVLPAIPTGTVLQKPFKAEITDEGEKHPVTRDLPGAKDANGKPTWGRWYRQVDVRPGRGRIVMQGADKKPLLILDGKSKGRVALLTSDQAWLWARGFEGGGPHTDLLRRLSHWLMKEPDLEEERLIASARELKLTLERYSMEQKVEDVRLSGPDGKTKQVALKPAGNGLFKATVDVEIPGLYKAESDTGTTTLRTVVHAGKDDPREMNDVVSTDKHVKELMRTTGGGTVWPRSADETTTAALTASDLALPRISMLQNAKVFSGSGWIGLKDKEAYVTRGVKVLPLFEGFLALAALLSLLALMWWREGR